MTYPLTLTWIGLLALTLVGWWLGHPPAGMADQPQWLLWIVLLLSAIKGHWVIDRFMGMRHAPLAFRLAVRGWLLAVLCAMALFL